MKSNFNRDEYIKAAKRINQRMVRAEHRGDYSTEYKELQRRLFNLGVRRLPERIATMEDKVLKDFVDLTHVFGQSIMKPVKQTKVRVNESSAERYRRMADTVNRRYTQAKKQGIDFFPEIKQIERKLKKYGLSEIPSSYTKAGENKKEWQILVSRMYHNPLMTQQNINRGGAAEVVRRFGVYFSRRGIDPTNEELAALSQIVLIRPGDWQELLGLYDSGQVIDLVSEASKHPEKKGIDILLDLVDEYANDIVTGKVPRESMLDTMTREYYRRMV